MPKKEQQHLSAVQNSMLRRIVRSRRLPDETWVDWIKRNTRDARAAARKAGVRFWVAAYLEAKWKWAGHVMRMAPDRPAKRITEWRDSEWCVIDEALRGRDRTRRPYKQRWFRWEDCLRQFATKRRWTSWQSVAQNRDQWRGESMRFARAFM